MHVHGDVALVGEVGSAPRLRLNIRMMTVTK